MRLFNDNIGYYFLLLIIYFIVSIFQASEEGGGGIGGRIVAVLFILFCFKHLLSKNKKISSLCKILCIFSFYCCIRDSILYFQDPIAASYSIRSLFLLLFWILGFAFLLKCPFYEEHFFRLSRILLVITIFYLCHAIFLQHTRIIREEELTSAIGTAGSAYMLVPIIFLCFRGKMKIFLVLFCFVICALSQKRQALLGFSIIFIFIAPDFFRMYFKKFKIGIWILLGIIVIAGGSVFNVLFGGIVSRQEALSNADRAMDNGREILRTAALNGFQKESIFSQIFGSGCGSGGRFIKDFIGTYLEPHNSYIDIMCAYGMIGLLLYCLIFLGVFRIYRKYKFSSVVFRLSVGTMIAWTISTFFTHPGNVWLIFFCLYFGFIYNYNGNQKEIDELILN